MTDDTRSLGKPTLAPQAEPVTAADDAPPTNLIEGLAGVAAGAIAPTAAGEPFTLLSEVGRGGMGVVYRARDNALDRDVAVKLLRGQLFSSASTAGQRFLQEAKITSRLQHPGIPPVYQVGTLDGRPFLAMKLIQGETLAELLASRELASGGRESPGEGLSGDSRPPLASYLFPAFEQICQAVGYAHSVGIIHRDLKPANVMVGAFGEVQVMDWGLVKVMASRASDGTGADRPAASFSHGASDTRAGSVMGTPAYMPPEQASGDTDRVDARSDVFGLGGILAAILTGKPPFVGTDTQNTLRLAAGGRLDDCFARLDACGAEPELVALCKRCLSPDKANRPADGGAVARAVGELRAAADDRARRAEVDRAKAEAEAREQRKRRKVQLALGLAVGLLLAAGGAFAWWEDRADREARFKDEEARLAKGTALQQLTASLGMANAYRAEYRYENAGHELKQARLLAERFAPNLLPVVDSAKATLDFVVELDAVRMGRAVWIEDSGGRGWFNEAGAAAAYQKAFAARGWDVAADPERVGAEVASSVAKSELVTALDDWAALLRDDQADLRRKVWAAATVADPASAVVPFRDPAVWADKSRAETLAANLDAARMTPGAVVAVAELLRRNGLSGERLLSRAVFHYPRDFGVTFSLAQSLEARADPKQVGVYRAARALRPESAAVLNNLGLALRRHEGDQPGAIAALREFVRLQPGSAAARTNLGVALYGVGDRDGALAEWDEAIRLDPTLATAHVNRGVLLAARGETETAAAAYRLAIRHDPDSYLAHSNLGVLLSDGGDVGGAIAAFREAIRLDPSAVAPHYNLGIDLAKQGDLPGAAAEFREAGRLDPKSVPARLQLGLALKDQVDFPGAARAFREAARLDENNPVARFNLGVVLEAGGDRAGAVAAYREAVRLAPDDAKAHTNLGNLLRATGDAPGALAAFREAVRVTPGSAIHQNNLGAALHGAGDLPGAVAAYTEALRLDPKFHQALFNLAIAEKARGNLDRAAAAYAELVRRFPQNAGHHTSLGETYLRQKKYPDAIAAARAALRADPGYAPAHAMLGDLLQLTGDLPGARAALTEAARLDTRWAAKLAKLPPIAVAPPPREKP